MRRLALSVFTACGIALLTACGSSGGYGFSSDSSSSSIDSVAFTNGSAQADNFTVVPGGTAPLQINAVGEKGTGPAALIVPDTVFTWATRFVGASDPVSVASYQSGATGILKPCPAYKGPTPAIPLYLQNNQYVPPYLPLPATQATGTVYLIPPSPATVPPPYCLVVQATHVGDNVIGTKTVLVTTSGTP